MNRRHIALVIGGVAGLAFGIAQCGGDDNGDGGPGDAQMDTTVSDGSNDGNPFSDGPVGNDAGPDGPANWNSCDAGTCICLGLKCTTSAECCSGNCYLGSCQPPPCTADNASCTTNAQCCGGTCGSTDGGPNTCIPLNPLCGTLGNPCSPDAGGTDCCSHFCAGDGICSQPSYCGQNGDICTANSDCCGDLCVKTPTTATFGLCATPPQQGAQCSQVDGVVCGSTNPAPDGGIIYTDSGVPQCGGACCSRDCAPYGLTGVLICQPAEGCKPVGDICFKTSDCCNFDPTNADGGPTEVCDIPVDGGAGTCHNPTGCKPNGDICRLQQNQCNATDNCCSGDVQKDDTCHQDNLGVPRCSYAGDAGCIPVDAGTMCASSADCCNLNPCVPSPDGGDYCYPQACVPTTGPCTNDSDCCPGGHCYIPGGQTSGTCEPFIVDAGSSDAAPPPPCAAYGQLCSPDGGGVPCCNNVPCTAGRCEFPVQ